MSADNPTNEKQSRRRRRLAETEAKVETAAAEEVAEDIEEADKEDSDESDISTNKGYTPKKGRPTPGRRSRVDEEEEGNVVVRGVGGLRGYFEDTREELKKVTWPTREEATRLTLIVLVVMIVSAIVLGAIGLLFAEIVRWGVATPIILIAFFAVIVAGVLGFLYWTNRGSGSSA
jgi:preprotein translocase subunit SecE